MITKKREDLLGFEDLENDFCDEDYFGKVGDKTKVVYLHGKRV